MTALRSLGRAGLANLIERTCYHARRFGDGLAAAGEQAADTLSLRMQAALLSINRTHLYYQPAPPSAHEAAIKHREALALSTLPPTTSCGIIGGMTTASSLSSYKGYRFQRRLSITSGGSTTDSASAIAMWKS